MSDWKEYYLSELGTLSRGKSKHRPRWAEHLYGGKYPFIQTGEITAANKYIDKYSQTYSDAGLAQSKLWKKGTLCITIAANIAEIAILKFPACFPDSVLGFIPDKEKANLDFTFYILKHFQSRLKKLAIGSVQDNINVGTFLNIKFSFPSIEEQKQIADVLSCIDAKIENLMRQNETLEQIAQTLFKHWFIDFEFPNADGKPYKSSGGAMSPSELGDIPEGWRVGKLGDIVKKANTGADAIQKAPIVDEDTGIKCLRVGDITNRRSFEEWGFCKVTNQHFSQYQLKKDDIIVTRTSALGLNVLILKDLSSVFNNGLIRIKIKDEINNIFVYYSMQNKWYKEYIARITYETSTRPNMQINYLLDFPLIYANKDLEERFSLFASVMLLKQDSNNQQIQTLTKTRDALLPKLMSGQLRVKE
jgi:type I restriction enzyme, S subunit